MRVFVESYGCTMNQGEGRSLERALASLGHEPVRSAADAEAVVLNTCTVIGTTERRMLRRMEEITSEGKRLVVTGCMAEVQREDVSSRFPDAVIVSPRDYGSFPEEIGERFGRDAPRGFEERGVTEIVPIAQGCLGSCTYCITRLARGRLASYGMDELRERVERGVGAGRREFLITAQDTAAYGMDEGTSLVRLMEELLIVPGEHRFRLGMMNPDHLSRILGGMMEVMRDPRMYRFLHLPVQSGSDRVLRRMGRRYTAEEYMSLVDTIRESLPDVTLSTDVIVGFPGEREEDHRATMELIERVRPDIVNVTRFSPRPMTPASSFSDQVHGREAKARSRELTELRFRIAEGIHATMVGREEEVVVTEPGKEGTVIARTDCYRPVVLPDRFQHGERVKVRIVGHAPTHLFGQSNDSYISGS